MTYFLVYSQKSLYRVNLLYSGMMGYNNFSKLLLPDTQVSVFPYLGHNFSVIFTKKLSLTDGMTQSHIENCCSHKG